MYATIRHYQGVTKRDERLVQAVRNLATGLSQAPGFVSFVVLETGSDALASVSIFEDRDSLASADRLVGVLLAEHLSALPPDPSQPITGEIVFQRGL